MGDAICLKCQEPWDLYYLGHEAMWDSPGAHAPERFQAHHDRLLEDDDAGVSDPHVYKDYGGEALQVAVLRGDGCPACWENPKRVIEDPAEAESALGHNLFNSGWDGDPAELL